MRVLWKPTCRVGEPHQALLHLTLVWPPLAAVALEWQFSSTPCHADFRRLRLESTQHSRRTFRDTEQCACLRRLGLHLWYRHGCNRPDATNSGKSVALRHTDPLGRAPGGNATKWWSGDRGSCSWQCGGTRRLKSRGRDQRDRWQAGQIADGACFRTLAAAARVKD
jgi:hypothetical protein